MTTWHEHIPFSTRRDKVQGVGVSNGNFFNVRIGSGLARELHWRPGDSIKVFFGENSDRHIRLVKGPGGFLANFAGKRRPKAQGGPLRQARDGFDPLMLRWSRPPHWSKTPRALERLPFSVVDGGIEFLAPDWLLEDAPEALPNPLRLKKRTS